MLLTILVFIAMTSNYDRLYKLFLIGDTGTGKSAILLRFADNKFSESYIATIGIDFKVKTLVVDDLRVKLQMWDTAGQERFHIITKSYYKKATGFFIVFDLSNRPSFKNVQNWKSEINNNSSGKTKVILLGCKSDLESSRQVSFDEGSEKAKELGMKYVEVSAKAGTNIQEAFNLLASDIVHDIDVDINMPSKKLNEEKQLMEENPKKLGANDVMKNLKMKCCGIS